MRSVLGGGGGGEGGGGGGLGGGLGGSAKSLMSASSRNYGSPALESLKKILLECATFIWLLSISIYDMTRFRAYSEVVVEVKAVEGVDLQR